LRHPEGRTTLTVGCIAVIEGRVEGWKGGREDRNKRRYKVAILYVVFTILFVRKLSQPENSLTPDYLRQRLTARAET
jgi:hypothetical protein